MLRLLDFLFSIAGRVLVWLVRQLARLIAWMAVQAVLHPRSSGSAACAGTAVVMVGWELCLTALGCAFGALSTWKAAHPASFQASVVTSTRTWWRKWWTYRRTWRENLTRCDLTVQAGTETFLPKLKGITTTPFWDQLTVEMQVGQAMRHFTDRSEELRTAFRAERIVIKEVKPRGLAVSFMRRDALREPVPATVIPASVEAIDFRRVPVGVDEFGQPYTVSLLGGHTSGAGAPGAGKAGLEWNILRGIAPAIAAGLVRTVFIDPKLKELSQACELCAPGDYVGHATEDLPKATIDLLTRLVAEMDAANNADASDGERDFVPRKGRPLTLIIIDELVPLLKYWKRGDRDKIGDLLGLLLTQGRAAGFIVIGLIQEPTKDIFPVRDLFARRIALRLPTASYTDAALVENATEYGAGCHEIPETMPGVFFSLQEGARSTIRARLGFVQNEDIRELVAYVLDSRKVVTLTNRTAVADEKKRNAA